MPARKKLEPKEAIDHLKLVYSEYLKEGGDPRRFTIRHYNRLNKDSRYYIDVYVKKTGGWNQSLQKAGIPLGFRQYREVSQEELSQYVKKVYKLYQAEVKIQPKHKGQEKTFRMLDYTNFNEKAGSRYSLAVVLKRFGSWSKVLRSLEIPIGRSRGLTHEQIQNHVLEVYNRFLKKEGDMKVFSKEMYDNYNFIEDVYISSKLVERRFGTWMAAKRKMRLF